MGRREAPQHRRFPGVVGMLEQEVREHHHEPIAGGLDDGVGVVLLDALPQRGGQQLGVEQEALGARVRQAEVQARDAVAALERRRDLGRADRPGVLRAGGLEAADERIVGQGNFGWSGGRFHGGRDAP
jgi:hypothetical protein